MDDKVSIITQDRLKKFNEIYGYENGPAVLEETGEEDDQFNEGDQGMNPDGNLDETRDEVKSLNESYFNGGSRS